MLERVARNRPTLGETRRAMRGEHVANGLVSFLFAATGPVALVLTVGIAGGLGRDVLASWIFAGFFGGALITIVMSWLYRQPLAHAWTISGTALIAPALAKYPYSDIVGTYIATGVLMAVLGLSGGFRKLMDWTPVPIVMAMVAGVFLKFGILAVDAFDKQLWIALAATASFLAASVVPGLQRILPPTLAALIGGAVATVALGAFKMTTPVDSLLAAPVLIAPTFNQSALVELVLPLAISVLALQNAQGIAVLRVAGHDAPVNTITTVCGVGSGVFGVLGAVCTCLTGPVNAILASSGKVADHYIGAYWWAFFSILFGLFAPLITALALATPAAFIFILGGLAMLRVLQQSFIAAFSGRFTLGALVTFIVTVTDLIPNVSVSMFGIGAAFWGLVFGVLTSLLLERADFKAKREAK